MANSSLGRFPDPHDFKVPKDLEGWEEMYPPQRLFSSDRADWEKRHFWYQDKIHAPEPMYPLDDIFHEGWQIALSQYTTRVFCIPPAQGVAHHTFNTIRRHITISVVLGAFGRAYYHIPEHTLRRAAQILLTGLSHDPRESTIVRLKELLVAKGHMMHGGVMVLSFYKKTEWALSQFALGRQVNRIQEATTELFPLPEEQEVKHG